MIPFINNLRLAMPMMGCLKYNTSDSPEWLIVDNGSTDPVEKYIMNFVKPKRMSYVRNDINPGLIANNNFAYNYCRDNEIDLLCLLHNDCFIYEKGWDQRVISYFEKMPDLGIAGFFGAQGCHVDGGRMQDTNFPGRSGYSEMLEAELHGMKMGQNMPWRPAAIFDSFCMVFRVEMLKKCNGFDTRYKWHHFYDRDSSLESLRQGYKNIVVNVPNHHIGGLTNENPFYQEWLLKQIGSKMEDGVVHNENKVKFMEKWAFALPLYVNDDFTFRTGLTGISGYDFKGDSILKK